LLSELKYFGFPGEGEKLFGKSLSPSPGPLFSFQKLWNNFCCRLFGGSFFVIFSVGFA